MPTTHIELISIPVSDPVRAKTFYEDALGFETVADVVVGPGMRWLQLRVPPTGPSISLVTWFTTMPAGSLRGLVLGSDDLDGDLARLRRHPLGSTGEITEEPWGRFVTVEDPDGNGLTLQTLRAGG